MVETALNPDHGSATGGTVRREEVLEMAAIAGRYAVEQRSLAFAQVAAQLAGGEEDGGGGAPAADSALWWDLSRSGRSGLCSEQLAYVAAFAVGAALVFGDRPKAVTYRRMLLCPSLADLDTAFGLQVSQSVFCFCAGQRLWGFYIKPRAEMGSADAPPHPAPLQSASNYEALAPGLPLSGGSSLTEEVLIRERDRVMAASLRAASLAAGAAGGCIVGVVGASHLPGLRQSWDAPGFLDGSAGAADAALTTVPAGAATEETAEQAGVRRALLDGVIRLTCRGDVSEDVQRELGPVAEASAEAHAWAAELYGNSRMLLAALDRGQLAQVCGGWRCDMWEVLAPLRAARPVNGGTGLDVDLTVSLRVLNFDLS